MTELKEEKNAEGNFFRVQRTVGLTAALLLVGCGDRSGHNETMVLNAVSAAAGLGAEITPVPNADWKYLVRHEDGSIWIYEAMSNKAEVTAKAKLMDAQILRPNVK